jgi:hypothetical protein
MNEIVLMNKITNAEMGDMNCVSQVVRISCHVTNAELLVITSQCQFFCKLWPQISPAIKT